MESKTDKGSDLNAAFSAKLAEILIPKPGIKSRLLTSLSRTFKSLSHYLTEVDDRTSVHGELERYRQIMARPDATLLETYHFARRNPQLMGEVALGSIHSLPFNVEDRSVFVRRYRRKILHQLPT